MLLPIFQIPILSSRCTVRRLPIPLQAHDVFNVAEIKPHKGHSSRRFSGEAQTVSL